MASDIATSSVLGEGIPDNQYVNSELVGKPICLDSDEDDEPATSETPKPAARNPKGRIRGKTKPDRSEPVKPPNVDQLMRQVIDKTHIDVVDATRNASIQASKKDAPRQDAPRQDEGVPSKGAGEPSKGDVSQGEVAGESEPSKGGDSKGEDAESSKGGDPKGEVPVVKKSVGNWRTDFDEEAWNNAHKVKLAKLPAHLLPPKGEPHGLGSYTLKVASAIDTINLDARVCTACTCTPIHHQPGDFISQIHK